MLFRSLPTDHGTRQSRQVLTALAEIEPSPDVNFEAMLREIEPRLTADATVVAVMLDASRERAARALLSRSRHSRVRLISIDAPAFRVLFEPPKGGPA